MPDITNELKTMHTLTLSIGTAYSDSAWTYSELKKGIENISEAMNYVINKYQFMSGEGWGNTHVTGAHNEYTLTGKRVYGDAAQDYIFSLKNQFGSARDSMLKLEAVNHVSGKLITWTQPICIADIQEWSGNTTDDSSINIVLSCNGKPTRTEAVIS